MRQLSSRLVGEGTGVRELEGLKVIPHIGGNVGRLVCLKCYCGRINSI